MENPGDLNDEFALMAPDTGDLPDHLTILLDVAAAAGRRGGDGGDGPVGLALPIQEASNDTAAG